MLGKNLKIKMKSKKDVFKDHLEFIRKKILEGWQMRRWLRRTIPSSDNLKILMQSKKQWLDSIPWLSLG
jgi:hypothetical protein